MKRFLNSVLCMCIAVFCTHAQKKNVTSVLEVMDITTGQRSVVKEFPFLIEAPNWTPDGNWLVYNSGGKLYKLSPESPGEPQLINSDYATRCNNDHVISADGKQIAISNGTKEDGKSRVYTLPFEGGVPRLITPLDPVKQAIADSWPNSMDDSCAREEWGWKPEYNLQNMTVDMLVKVKEKFDKGLIK